MYYCLLMLSFLRTRWELLLVLAIFIACKIPHLFYAFYWDECWPYAAAVKTMYQHGPSLLPSALDPDFSRGHPLLFHAAAATWMKIFGTSRVAMHSFPLLVSVLVLCAVYEAGARLFNKRVAILATVLVAVQTGFFVQAAFLLPEIMVALLVFTSMYFYATEKYLLTMISLSALFFVKESGLIAGFVIGLAAIVQLFNKKLPMASRLYGLAAVAVPCLLILVFFIAQKHIRGWYIFPLHEGLIEHTWTMFWYNFRMQCLNSMLLRDNRNYYFIVLLVLSLIAAMKTRSLKYLVIFFPAVIFYYFADDMRAGRPLPSVPFFILFLISVMWMLYVLRKLQVYTSRAQQLIIYLSCTFIPAYCSFSALIFFTPRYMLAAIVPLLFFAAVAIDFFIGQTHRVLFYPVLAIVVGIGVCWYATDYELGDSDPGAFDGLTIHQEVVDYMEGHNYYDQIIGSGSFLEGLHLTNPQTGFRHTDQKFTHVRREIDSNTTVAIFDTMEHDARRAEVKNNPQYHLAKRLEKGKAWGEIYVRN